MIDQYDKEKTSPVSSVRAFLRRSLRRHSEGPTLRSSLRRTTTLNDIRSSLRKEPGKSFVPKKNYETCYDFEYEDFKTSDIEEIKVTDDQLPEALTPIWKSHLYQSQLKAPKPQRVVCSRVIEKRPQQYGKEYHGLISREEAEELVMKCEGCYLTRERQKELGTYALTFRFNDSPKHYRLYYDEEEKTHYVGEKRFETIHDLVEDGLITMYVELNEKDYINQMTLNVRRKKEKLITDTINCDSKTEKDDNGNLIRKTSATRQVQNSFKASECEKAHNFKVHTFYMAWCHFCENFMWGLKYQGLRCVDCSFDCHKQCIGQVPLDCNPDKKLLKRVFGVDLTTLIKAHDQRRPHIVDRCIDEIELRGLDVEGLYRVPGFADDITDLKNSIDKDGIVPNISKDHVKDINVICGLLKLYLRTLPIPIITFDLYDRFVEASKITDKYEIIKSLSEAVTALPPAHYETLKYMCRHLQRVTKFRDKNLMTPENLGIVFGPTLMRAPDHLLMEAVGYIPYQKKIIQFLIEEQDVLFDK